MDTRQYLNQLNNIDKRIKDKLNDAHRWKEIAFSRSIGGSKDASIDRVQSSHKPDKISDAIAKAIDYENEAKEDAKKLVELKHIIIQQIDGIKKEECYNILRMYYIDDMTLSDIALKSNYSYMHTKRKFNNAILEFEKEYGTDF